MITYTINTFQWLQLTPTDRNFCVEVFKIPRTSASKVFNHKVMSDGHSNDDLKAITVEKINKILGTKYSQEQILQAFNHFLDNSHGTHKVTIPEGSTQSTSSQQDGTGDTARNETESTVSEDSEPSRDSIPAESSTDGAEHNSSEQSGNSSVPTGSENGISKDAGTKNKGPRNKRTVQRSIKE